MLPCNTTHLVLLQELAVYKGRQKLEAIEQAEKGEHTVLCCVVNIAMGCWLWVARCCSA